VFVLYVVTIGRLSMTATDAALIALGERFEMITCD
jgi:predicted nucleic acid-binding protein